MMADMHWSAALAIGVALLTIIGMLARPWGSAEWVWAVAGALAEVAIGAVSLPDAWAAVAGGADVYAFLIGILVLAEIARSQGVFEWLAGRADEVAGGSRHRLLLLLYGVGVVVTATLSNDTAIIVLTPAALALARRMGGSPLPLLFACAFVANAASFLLPTGNPANLLVYGRALPALLPWVAAYGVAAAAAILLTYGALVWSSRTDLCEPIADRDGRPQSTPAGRLAFGFVIASALALILASALSWSLGLIALACAVVTGAVLISADRSVALSVARGTSWSVVPLVAGLLVVVAALEGAGITRLARAALDAATALPPWFGREVAGLATAGVVNAANNLPIAAFAARVLAEAPHHPLTHAVVVGIDLGPNLSLSGSLATVLWLLILRREGIEVSAWQFIKRGTVVLLPALFVALALAR